MPSQKQIGPDGGAPWSQKFTCRLFFLDNQTITLTNSRIKMQLHTHTFHNATVTTPIEKIQRKSCVVIQLRPLIHQRAAQQDLVLITC